VTLFGQALSLHMFGYVCYRKHKLVKAARKARAEAR